MNINELFSIKESEPDKFWGELSNVLLDERRGDKFLELLQGLTIKAHVAFLAKKGEHVKLPYHIGYCLQDDSLQFRYFVQMIAQSDEEVVVPKPIITGILPFPNERCYTFRMHDNGQGQNEVDVFVPHMIDRYAKRSYRMPDDIDMPNTWHKEKRTSNAVDFNEKEVERLFRFVGKFFARNKLNRLCKNENAMSLKEQETSPDDHVCLWMDGVTYCKPFCKGNVWLHKTFVPYWKDASAKDDVYLGEDQLESIAGDLDELMKEASMRFPAQYGMMELSILDYIKYCHSLWHSIGDNRMIPAIQDKSRGVIDLLEHKGFIKVDWNLPQPPKFPSKDLCKTKTFIETMNVDAPNRSMSELASNALQMWSSLWWHMREFDDWDTEAVKLVDKNAARRMICLMHGLNVHKTIIGEVNLLSKLCIGIMR